MSYHPNYVSCFLSFFLQVKQLQVARDAGITLIPHSDILPNTTATTTNDGDNDNGGNENDGDNENDGEIDEDNNESEDKDSSSDGNIDEDEATKSGNDDLEDELIETNNSQSVGLKENNEDSNLNGGNKSEEDASSEPKKVKEAGKMKAASAVNEANGTAEVSETRQHHDDVNDMLTQHSSVAKHASAKVKYGTEMKFSHLEVNENCASLMLKNLLLLVQCIRCKRGRTELNLPSKK